MRPIAELCVADGDLHGAPRAALDDFLANRAPPPNGEKRRGRRRGRDWRYTSEEYHAYMMGREKD